LPPGPNNDDVPFDYFKPDFYNKMPVEEVPAALVLLRLPVSAAKGLFDIFSLGGP